MNAEASGEGGVKGLAESSKDLYSLRTMRFELEALRLILKRSTDESTSDEDRLKQISMMVRRR